MSKGAKTRKKLERVSRKRVAKAQRQIHKEKTNARKVANRKKASVRDPNSRNIGDARIYPVLNLPFLARTRLLERAGVPNQYTSKYPRALVDRYIEQHGLTL